MEMIKIQKISVFKGLKIEKTSEIGKELKYGRILRFQRIRYEKIKDTNSSLKIDQKENIVINSFSLIKSLEPNLVTEYRELAQSHIPSTGTPTLAPQG